MSAGRMFAIYRRRFASVEALQAAIAAMPAGLMLFASYQPPYRITLQIPVGTEPPDGWMDHFVEEIEGGLLTSAESRAAHHEERRPSGEKR